MKAAVITRYGPPDVIKICDVPKPTPQAGEVLVRVHTTTVNRTDSGQLRPHPTAKPKLLAAILTRFLYGLLRPRRTIFGMDFAGEVEATGTSAPPDPESTGDAKKWLSDRMPAGRSYLGTLD